MPAEFSRQIYAHVASQIADRRSCEKAHLAIMLLVRMLVSAEMRQANGHLTIKVTYAAGLKKVFAAADEEQHELTTLY